MSDKFRVRVGGVYPDQPNANGRIYPRSVVESIAEQMKELADKKTLFVTNSPSSFDVDSLRLQDVIAMGDNVEVDEEGIEVDIDFLPIESNEPLIKMSELDMASFSLAGTGIMDEDDSNIIRDASFSYLNFGPKLPDRPTISTRSPPPKPSPLTEKDIMGQRILDL